MTHRKHRILLVEDRASDVRLTKRALRRAGYTEEVEVAENGKEALDRLRGLGPYENSPKPDLVLLDWMMPIINGQEVLTEMRQDPNLRRIPVVVLTTSGSEIDIQAAYNEGCNAYLVKPVDPTDFQDTVNAMGLFWLQKAVLPRN